MKDIKSEYAQRKTQHEAIQRQVTLAEGGIKTIQKQITQELGISSEKTAYAERDKLARQLQQAEAEFAQACEEYDAIYGDQQ